MAIPLILFYFIGLKRRLPFRPIFVLFGLFITACGWTHFMGYYTFYTPIYRMDGMVKLITAFVSWLTVFALIPVVPRVLSMRTPEEMEAEIAARKRAEENLQRAHDSLEQRVQERTTEIQLLNKDLRRSMAETHHRVKNNLQVVSALLEMQMEEAPDAVPRAAVRDSLRQIKTIAIVHDLLSHTHGAGKVDAVQVLKNLMPLLSAGMQTGGEAVAIALETGSDPIYLPTKAATGLALVVNELVSNAVKHGRSMQRRTDSNETITVRLTREPEESLLLAVEDTGQGFPDSFDVKKDANLGLELVQSIVANDLQGSIQFSNQTDDNDQCRGACVNVRLPEHPNVE
jgi:two-component sensor histidine kinase